MNQTMSTPKGRPPPFKIVFAPGGGSTPPTVRKVGRPKKKSMSDLEAAVHSITDGGVVTNINDPSPLVRTANATPQKILTYSNPQGPAGNKMEKIVFLPKFIQKKVTVLKDPTPKKRFQPTAIRSPMIMAPVKHRSVVVGQGTSALRNIVAAVNDKVSVLPKKRKLGDIALESWQVNRKPVSAPAPSVELPLLSPALLEGPVVLCRLCGTAIRDEVVELLNDSTGAVTQTGAKLKTLTGNEVSTSENAPKGCCKQCSIKVQLCFSLLMEIQAADVVSRDTFAEATDDSKVNLKERLFTCKDCDQEVVGMKDFIRHQEVHVQERTIGVSTTITKIKTRDVEAENAKLQELMESAKDFLENDLEDDGMPVFQNELGEYVCELCGYIFKYKYLLLMHRKAPSSKHENAAQNCFVCGQAKPDLSQYNNTCGDCKAQQVKEDGSEDTEPADEGYAEEEAPRVAMKTKKSYNRRGDYLYCAICKKSLLRTSYRAHMAKHGEMRYFCNICEKGFLYKYALRQHFAKIHNSEQPFTYVGLSDTCWKCGLKMADADSVRQHMVEKHGTYNTALLSCSFCDKTFPEMFKLRMHLRMLHSYELPQNARSSGDIQRVICHVCGTVLSSAHATKIHMKEIHGLSTRDVAPLKEECELCGKEFVVKQNLINHINTAHLNVKPMPCDVCGARFAKHSSLIFHRFRHTGEKPFKCSVCLKLYRQRNDVIRHLARHVRDKEVAYEDAYALNISSSKFVTKRNVFLKDSTIKGLVDMTLSTVTRRKGRKPGKQVLFFQEVPEIYEEVVAPDGGEEQADETTMDTEQFENLQIVIDDEGEISYVVEDGGDYEALDGDVQYVIEEQAEDTEQVTDSNELISLNTEARYVDENGEEVNVKYVFEDNGQTFIRQEVGSYFEEVDDEAV